MKGRHAIAKGCAVLAAMVCAACASSSGAAPGPAGAPGPHRQAIFPPGQSPNGIYSPGIRTGNLIFFSGQIGATEQTRAMTQGRVEAEVQNALDSLERIMTAAGVTKADVVKCTVFLADIGDYNAMNGVYRAFFGDSPPARTAVAVNGLPGQAVVEIECFAAAR
jgi:2-iminobutanoate/2-iminopropanoate deaminase